MKRMKCLDCDESFEAETSKDMMQAMHPHYMEKHQDIMKNANEENKKVWFTKFNEEWEKTEEIFA